MRAEQFTGRAEELARLLELAQEAAAGNRRVALVAGEVGVGKTSLLGEFRERLEVDLPDLGFQTARANCYPGVAYLPILTLLQSLIVDAPSPTFRERVVPALREVAPDLLSLIPVIGPALKTVSTSAVTAGRLLTEVEASEFAAVMENKVLNILKVLRVLSKADVPLALLIDNAQDLDFSSSAVLQKFLADESEAPVLVVLAYRDQEMSPHHPLRKIREIRVRRPSSLPLRGLSSSEIESYLEKRYGSRVARGLAHWLAELSNGLPLYIEEYLALLEENETIITTPEPLLRSDVEDQVRSWRSGDPDPLPRFASAFDVLKDRVELLEPSDRDLLALCALSGPPALSWVIARLGKKDEDDVEKDLGRLARRADTIRVATREEWIAAFGEISDVYEFVHLLMHEALYQELPSARLRRRLHERTAMLLEDLSTSITKDECELPSAVDLLIADQYRRANKIVEAALRELDVARQLMARGAPTEAFALCSRVLQALRNADTAPPQLIAEAATLLLTAAEIKQPPIRDATTGTDLEDVAAEAVRAADATGEANLRVQARYLRGKVTLRARGLDAGIRCLREALDQARVAEDRRNEFAVLSSLGHHLMSKAPGEGSVLLHNACQVYDLIDRTDIDEDGLRILEAERDVLEARLGVRDFDQGDYGSALERLRRSVSGLKSSGLINEVGWPTNFLGQLLIAIGAYEEADAVLQEYLQLAESDLPRAAKAANRALLGKLHLEQQHVQHARQILREALEETETVGHRNVVPIVQNYMSEALLADPASARDLDECLTLLEATVQETNKTGFERSRAQALYLRSLLHLRSGNTDGAKYDIDDAIELVRTAGVLPTVRTEELLFLDYRVQAAAGDSERALTSLKEALAVLWRKAHSISDDGYRESYFNRVSLNQAITVAARRERLPNPVLHEE
jgi:tetratricopeptide (TPR) repeat protein/type II secretory pathway predicted ATPase ExeA